MTVLTATTGAQSAAWERLRDVFSWSRGSSHPWGTASLWPSATRMRLTKYSALRRFLLFGLKRFLATCLSLSHTTPCRVRMLSASLKVLRSSARNLLSLNPQRSLARAAPISLQGFRPGVRQSHRRTCQSGCDHNCLGLQGLVTPLRNGCKAQVCSVSARAGERLILRRRQRAVFETENFRSGFVVY